MWGSQRSTGWGARSGGNLHEGRPHGRDEDDPDARVELLFASTEDRPRYSHDDEESSYSGASDEEHHVSKPHRTKTSSTECLRQIDEAMDHLARAVGCLPEDDIELRNIRNHLALWRERFLARGRGRRTRADDSEEDLRPDDHSQPERRGYR